MARPSKGDRVAVVVKFPTDVLAALDSIRDGQDRMEWIVEACLDQVKRQAKAAQRQAARAVG